jgi:ABC-2 type transporter
VYNGELGFESRVLIEYFEGHGAGLISVGDNPANWMLRELPLGKEDYADLRVKSPEYAALREQLARAKIDPPIELEITYTSEFAVGTKERQRLVTKRLQTVYWRSPAYNLSRLLVCIAIAFILGSVFITERELSTLSESDMRAYFSVTFLSFIIIGILSMTSVLPVMLGIRDVFYKQRAAGMVDSASYGWALGAAEKWFIVLASSLFVLVYLATSGTFPSNIRRSLRYWVSKRIRLAIGNGSVNDGSCTD